MRLTLSTLSSTAKPSSKLWGGGGLEGLRFTDLELDNPEISTKPPNPVRDI